MKKLSILLLVLFWSVQNKGYSKQVEIVNMSDMHLAVKVLTIHDYFQFVGTTATGPGPVTHGCDFGSLSSYSLSSTIVIIPPGQTVDLYSYVNGVYDASLNNNGFFPFGWSNSLNPFYNQVFPYTTVGGVDAPSSTTPTTLPLPWARNYCVKSITVGWVYPSAGGNFNVQYEMTHTSADPLQKMEMDTNFDVYVSRYEHHVATNWVESECVKDRLVFTRVAY